MNNLFTPIWTSELWKPVWGDAISIWPNDLAAMQRLFSNGELGGYWPADPAYAYEDSAGTTAASVNGVVGLRFDVSNGVALGPDLVTNGGFATGDLSGWSVTQKPPTQGVITYESGAVRIDGDGSWYPNILQDILSVGSIYIVTFNKINESGTTGFWRFQLGDNIFEKQGCQIGVNQFSGVCGGPSVSFALLSSFNGSIVVDDITCKEILGNHAIQTTTGNKPYLRLTPTTNKPWYDSNTWTGALTATFSGALGSACTIATVTPEGVSILESQTVGATYNICPAYGYNADVLIIDRALTVAEKALVTRVMQRSVPSLGSNLAVNGSFATDTDWTKGTGWSIDGTAAKSAGTASNLTQTLGVSGNQYRVTADITRTAGTVGAYNGTAQIGATAATETAAKYAMKTTSTTVGFRGDASFSGTVDNAVIQEIL